MEDKKTTPENKKDLLQVGDLSDHEVKIHALRRISNANTIIDQRLQEPHVTTELRELLERIKNELFNLYPNENYLR